MRGLGLCPNAMGAIGNTPLVKLSNINAALKLPHGSFIYAKLENLSVGGSKKDRVAKQIVGDALADGSLKAGQRIVELTSGNTGTGLAIVAAAMNHPFTAVMSKGNSPERARMMTALGADVVLVEQAAHSVPGQVSGEDLDLVEAVTRGIVKEGGAFRADQFALPGSYRAHYLNTGPEAWEQSGKCLDGFVDFVGSGGTFVGIAKYLKEQRGDEGEAGAEGRERSASERSATSSASDEQCERRTRRERSESEARAKRERERRESKALPSSRSSNTPFTRS